MFSWMTHIFSSLFIVFLIDLSNSPHCRRSRNSGSVSSFGSSMMCCGVSAQPIPISTTHNFKVQSFQTVFLPDPTPPPPPSTIPVVVGNGTNTSSSSTLPPPSSTSPMITAYGVTYTSPPQLRLDVWITYKGGGGGVFNLSDVTSASYSPSNANATPWSIITNNTTTTTATSTTNRSSLLLSQQVWGIHQIPLFPTSSSSHYILYLCDATRHALFRYSSFSSSNVTLISGNGTRGNVININFFTTTVGMYNNPTDFTFVSSSSGGGGSTAVIMYLTDRGNGMVKRVRFFSAASSYSYSSFGQEFAFGPVTNALDPAYKKLGSVSNNNFFDFVGIAHYRNVVYVTSNANNLLVRIYTLYGNMDVVV
eukprot:PhF_6_TR37582/c0_g2_i4/m.55757